MRTPFVNELYRTKCKQKVSVDVHRDEIRFSKNLNFFQPGTSLMDALAVCMYIVYIQIQNISCRLVSYREVDTGHWTQPSKASIVKKLWEKIQINDDNEEKKHSTTA